MFGKVFILVPLFFLTLYCKTGSTDDDFIERDRYRNIIKSNVVPSYIEAYKIFKEKIIGKLIHFNINESLVLSESEDNETRIHQFVQQLHCNIRRMNEQLNETMDVSFQTMKRVEGKIIPTQKKIEKQKRRILDITSKALQLDISIANVTNLINITENSIKDKEKVLNSAQVDVNEAESKLEGAKLCRNKRFLIQDLFSTLQDIGNKIATGVSAAAETVADAAKDAGDAIADTAKVAGGAIDNAVKDTGDAIVDTAKVAGGAIDNAVKDTGDAVVDTAKVAGGAIDNAVKDTGDAVVDTAKVAGETIADGAKEYIVRPLCSIINEGGISNARHVRNEALNNLQNARDQLKKYQNRSQNYQNTKQRLEFDLTRANNSINMLNTELDKLYTNLNVTTTINYELKIAVHHITILSTRSNFLKEEIKHLVDFNLLITPLNNVYNELKDNNLLSQAIDKQYVLITEQEVESIKNSLNDLSDILPNVPTNTSENEITDDDINCDE